ncbi:hypothetical protein QFZ60_000489 [Arthrobacter sp. B2I5]|nr:hypothetical protein [Arthrobacter sp. B2I5]MDQ0824316.1 hypothetical protein [Arthrobacter sp. B2I5]
MKREPYTGPWITLASWVHWEIRRYLLETEAPGRYGTYSKEDAPWTS